MSYRKIPNAIQELLGITLTPGALIGFEKLLNELAQPIVDDIAKKIASSDEAVHADAVKQFVKRGCEFHRLRGRGRLTCEEQAVEKAWLRPEQSRLETWVLSDGKAATLQARIVTSRDEWLVFLDDARVPPTNNLAEQALRPLVVLRKITFGHRCLKGGQRMAALMSVAETARRHGHRTSRIFLALMSYPPSQVLRQLYAVA